VEGPDRVLLKLKDPRSGSAGGDPFCKIGSGRGQDVWAAIQGPYVKLGEISREIAPDSFLDASFIEVANNWTLDEVIN